MIDNTLFKKIHGCNVGGYVGAALGEPSRRAVTSATMVSPAFPSTAKRRTS